MGRNGSKAEAASTEKMLPKLELTVIFTYLIMLA